jgi:nucleoside-diphosphate-sugar epimerase
MKILITGASGFIGTNLIDYYIEKGVEVSNIDIKEPLNPNHKPLWRKVNLLDKDNLSKEVSNILPDYIIHLAARTDLNGQHIKDYSVNTQGTQNLIDISKSLPNLKKILFASTMYVCKVGYTPNHDRDYCPHTIYGESKVEMEEIIRHNNLPFEWTIVRPTSIWGPWFGEPYRNFFDIILSKKYLDIGSKSCTKTYGYVENTVYQIDKILLSTASNENTYYLGDYEPIFISEWSKEIAKAAGKNPPIKIPYFLLRTVAILGNLIQPVFPKFPMTTFRLYNMTTDNVHDLSKVKEIVGQLPFNRIEGIAKTISWIRKS